MSNLERIKGINYDCFFLNWDTDYFGVNSARVNLTGPVDEEGQEKILDYCKGYEFVTIVNNNNIKENNYWIGTKTNAFLADMNIQFIKELKDKPSYQDGQTYVENNLSINEQLAKIANCSFHYSRFFNDPNLPEKQAKNVYRHWTECAFEQVDKYFIITEREGQAAGYLLFSINGDHSVIELYAVAEKYQGQGVGKSLIQTLESFIMNKKINKIRVGTQVNNVLAAQFYLKIGFTYVSCGSIYHLWRR